MLEALGVLGKAIEAGLDDPLSTSRATSFFLSTDQIFSGNDFSTDQFSPGSGFSTDQFFLPSLIQRAAPLLSALRPH